MKLFNSSMVAAATVLALGHGAAAVAHAPRARHDHAVKASAQPLRQPVIVWREWSDLPAAAGDCAKVAGVVGGDSLPLTCVVTPAAAETSAAACLRVFQILPQARCVPQRPARTAAREEVSR